MAGYLPAVYYYQGRVREGLKTAGFVDQTIGRISRFVG